MNSKQILYLLTIALLLTSCSSMYIPAVRSIPLLEKKGEFQAEGGVSTNSVYANVSAAITNDIAVSVNGNMSWRNFSDRYDLFTDIYEEPPSGSMFFDAPDDRGKFAHRYGEVSMGKINISSLNKVKLEVFSGAGMGRATDIDYFSKSDNYKTDYYSIFGNVNVGIRHQIVEAGGSMRLAFSLFNYAAHYGDERTSYQDKFGAFHIEPMGFCRIGGKNLKAVFRFGINLAFPININEESEGRRGFDPWNGKWENTNFHLSIGVSYRIGGNKNHKFH